MSTTIGRLACTAGLAVTALAGAAAGSGADSGKALACSGPAQACMTDAEYRALLIRSVALNRKYGLGEQK